jgi:hypothetical protein
LVPREPQIRTNLEEEIYQVQLDELLTNVPGSLGAGLVNIRFREGCLRLPGGRAAAPDELRAITALTAGLFGDDAEERAPEFAAALGAARPADSAYLSFAHETLLISRLDDGEKALLLTVSASLNQGFANNLRRSVSAQIDADGTAPAMPIGPLLESTNEVLLGVLLDLRAGTVIERYDRNQGTSVLAVDDGLIESVRALFSKDGSPRGLRLRHRNGQPIEIRRAELAMPQRSLHWARIRFDPEHLMVLSADRGAVPGLLSIMMRSSETEIVRVWVDGLLSYGIKSTMSPFPETQTEFLDIVRQLRQLDENDLLGRLDIGGFANYSIGEGDDMQRCQECIYYLPNGKWCDLPELPVPVEPHWWCRLWKM